MSTAVPLRRYNPTAEVVLVTPELAAEWLGHNTRNRALKNAKIEQYTRDILAGRWQVTGEAIKFSADGRLLDGQNRLHAVIRAEKPIMTLVVRGLRDDAQDVMDSGAARSASDALALAGVQNASRVAGAARIAMSIEIAGRTGTRKFTNAEVQAWVINHLEITEAPRLLGADARLIPLPPSVRLYAAYRFAMIDEPAAVDFISQLATGVGVTSNDSPILALRRRLSGSYGVERRISIDEQLMAVFRAWNAWRQGRSLERVLSTSRAGRGLPELV